MNLRKIIPLLALAIAFPVSLGAIQITGKVTEIAGDVATIAMDGDVLPSVGDKVEIYFKLGKAEVSVGNAHITEATTRSVKAKIDNATGSPAANQLVRITLGKQSQISEKPMPTKPTGSNPVVGDWTGAAPGDSKVSFSFKADNTLLWVVEQPTSTMAVTAKYRVDTTVMPNVVEFFDFEEGEFKGATLRGFFELQSDGRLKIDLSEKQERGFSDRETLLMSRATTPIVRPSPVASSSASASAKPADVEKVLIGHERLLARDYDGAIQAYTEAINLNSTNAAAFDGRGDAFARKDDFDSAINDWQNAISLDPKRKQTLEPLIDQAKKLKDLNKVLSR